MEESFWVESRLCAIRIWCTTLSKDPSHSLHSCCGNARNAPCQSFLAPLAYRADVSHRKLQDIHPCDNCEPPSNGRLDQKASAVMFMTTLRDNGRIWRRGAKYGHLMKDERVLVRVKCLSRVLHARNKRFLSVQIRSSKQKQRRYSWSI